MVIYPISHVCYIIINNLLHIEKLFTKRELHDEFRKENYRFLHDVKSFTHDCYENSSVTKST